MMIALFCFLYLELYHLPLRAEGPVEEAMAPKYVHMRGN